MSDTEQTVSQETNRAKAPTPKMEDNTMKKLMAMLLALVMVMSLAACGEQKNNDNAGDAAPDDANTTLDSALPLLLSFACL